MTTTQADEPWHSAWPDVVAFASVLFLAWWTQARATDLVWSLWLSSLVVGYAIILWAIVRPCAQVATAALHDHALMRQALAETSPRTMMLAGTIGVIVALFVLAFFTVHFVGFHYVHAGFLSTFFPLDGDWEGARAAHLQGRALFGEVLRRYWVYLPAAFLAERSAFAPRTGAALLTGGTTMLPYRKVLRMHGLIFFFALARAAGLDNFAVYTVVYAVYFFPWRLVRRESGIAQVEVT